MWENNCKEKQEFLQQMYKAEDKALWDFFLLFICLFPAF